MANGERRTSEQGLVSIMVTMIIMLVLTLITIGFAKLVRQQQIRVLNNQLSSEAFYAAESGVNDAEQAIKDGWNGSPSDPPASGLKTDCGPDGTAQFGAGSNIVDPTDNVQYTCLLITANPNSLKYTAVQTKYIPINAPSAVNTLLISWQANQITGTPTIPGTYPSFPPQSAWPGDSIGGVLRIALTPTTGSLDRSTLTQNTFTAFLYPDAGSSGCSAGAGCPPNTVRYTSTVSSQGPIVEGNCNTGNGGSSTTAPLYCNVEITNLSQTNYFLALKSIYTPNDVDIATVPALALSGAQSVIDSTGRAQDVLRRIQVRVPSRDSYEYPQFVLQTGDSLCKELGVAPPSTVNRGNGDPACDPFH